MMRKYQDFPDKFLIIALEKILELVPRNSQELALKNHSLGMYPRISPTFG